jgi:exodeoxyribonuclease-5
MVGRRMAADLMSFGVPILGLGDPGQLPPVEDEDFLASFEPDFFLTEIHRQAEDNPIIHLSKLAREGEDLPYGDYGDGVIVMDRQQYAFEGEFDNRPAFIVGMNKTRWKVSQMLRQCFGYIEDVRAYVGPRAGEPLLVKKNIRKYPGLINGTDCFAMTDFDLAHGKASGLYSFETDEGVRYENERVFQGLFEEHFSRSQGAYTCSKGVAYHEKKRTINLDFNYVRTAHSSQGSQFDDVVVIDESHVFGADANRHLYTSITRAAKTLVVLR